MGLIDKLRQGLLRTRDALNTPIEDILRGRVLDDAVLEELEEVLLGADVGVSATMEIIEHLRERGRELRDPAQVKGFIKAEMAAMLGAAMPLVPDGVDKKPFVILVAGVNGVGKTTTIGKLASRFTGQGRGVMLAAADTFRAAAIEQLQIWADRAGTQLVKHKSGSDPAAVAFDAVEAAAHRGLDVVIVDTAGRLHTKAPLMEELKKVKRVVAKAAPGAPHEVLLVLDATTGQNALSQARTFDEALGVSGIVLTKLDGTAKGGIVLAIQKELGIPVRLIGIGEGLEDLRDFQPEEFVEALFGS